LQGGSDAVMLVLGLWPGPDSVGHGQPDAIMP